MFTSKKYKNLLSKLGNDREDENGRRQTTFIFDNENNYHDKFCWNRSFFIFWTKSTLSTSVFIFSTISQILKQNFTYFGHKHVKT